MAQTNCFAPYNPSISPPLLLVNSGHCTESAVLRTWCQMDWPIGPVRTFQLLSILVWQLLEKSVPVLNILLQGFLQSMLGDIVQSILQSVLQSIPQSILQIILRTNEAHSLLPAPHSRDISASAFGSALQCTTSVWYKNIFGAEYSIKYFYDMKYSGMVHNFNFKVICHKLLLGVEYSGVEYILVQSKIWCSVKSGAD